MSCKGLNQQTYAKWILANRMSCNNCKKRPGQFANGRWCKKCSQPHKDELITMLPLEVFMTFIHPFLSYMDILNLSGVSKDMNLYFNENVMWKKFHMGIKCVRAVPKQLKTLSWKKIPPNPTIDWTDLEPGCTLLIKNKSQIPMDVYYVVNTHRSRQPGSRKLAKHGSNLKPGEEFQINTAADHRWICFPTRSWLFKNPVSNVGFTFVINILKLTDIDGIPCFVKLIEQPKKLNPIKGLDQKHNSHKKAFIRLSIDPAHQAKRLKEDRKANLRRQGALKKLYKKVHVLEKEHVEFQRSEASRKMIQDIVIEGPGSTWVTDELSNNL